MYSLFLDEELFYITDNNYKVIWRISDITIYTVGDRVSPSVDYKTIYTFKKSTEAELNLIPDELKLELL